MVDDIIFYQKKLIDEQEKYIELLQLELKDTAPLASMMDWTSHRHEDGRKKRFKIKKLERILGGIQK